MCLPEEKGIKPARLNIASERFLQEVSHKSVFLWTSNQPMMSQFQVWEKLPFGTLEKGAVVSLFQRFHVWWLSRTVPYTERQRSILVPSLSSLESPYYAWTLLDDLNGAFWCSCQQNVKDGKVVYVATEDNVIKFTFNSHENGCGSIENVQKILKEPTPWKGEVTSLVVAPFLDSLFVDPLGQA